MLFGHNTNLKLGALVFDVQTEDRGVSHALIDTTVYYHGRVLHRRTNNYFDLLPLNDDRREALRLRLEDQHATVIEEIRSGSLQLAAPATDLPVSEFLGPPDAPELSISGGLARPGIAAGPSAKETSTKRLLLELTNAKSWLTGKHARLNLAVREENGNPVAGARVYVSIEGGENGILFESKTDSLGGAELEFEMPKITSGSAALVICAESQLAKGHLRFALRAKPRVA